MATLTESNIADLLTSTRSDTTLDGKFNQIATRFTKYYARQWFKKDKLEFQSGDRIDGSLLVNHSFSATMVGLHEVLKPNIPDIMTTFNVPWRHTNHNWSWERRENLMNKGRDQVFDLMKARRIGSEISLVELLETEVWSKPADSTNVLDVFGIPYWVIKATSNTSGFNGGNPSGFSSGAGNVNSTNFERWKNFNATYVNINEDDLLREMRQAYRKTHFVSPVTIDDYRKGVADNHGIYMNEVTIDGCEVEMRTRNDAHQNLTEFMGATAFKRQTLQYVPKLDDDSNNPVYMLNHNWMCPVCLKGDVNYEHPPKNTANQPNTWVIHEDLTWNWLCTDRRQQAVISIL